MRLYLSSYRLGTKPEELVKLFHGHKKIAVIANAIDFKSKEEREAGVQREIEDLRDLELIPEELDLRKYFQNNSRLKEKIGEYNGLWLRGGNAFVLRRALSISGADKIIKEFLDKDEIVFAGYSAGPIMLCPTLHGTELVDDPNVVPQGYDKKIIWEGLGVLPYVLAPHFKSDHPESAMVDKMVEYLSESKIAYKTLSDGEVIVVNGKTG